jgi:hypothetical protein
MQRSAAPPFHVRRTIMKAPRGLVRALIETNRVTAISKWITAEFGAELSSEDFKATLNYTEDARLSILRSVVEEREELRIRVASYEAHVRTAVTRLNSAYDNSKESSPCP